MCCHRRASEARLGAMEDWGCEGLQSTTGEEKEPAVATLRRFPNVASSRGGVPNGDLRNNGERLGKPLSSSKVRLVLVRVVVVGFRIVMGRGDRLGWGTRDGDILEGLRLTVAERVGGGGVTASRFRGGVGEADM